MITARSSRPDAPIAAGRGPRGAGSGASAWLRAHRALRPGSSRLTTLRASGSRSAQALPEVRRRPPGPPLPRLARLQRPPLGSRERFFPPLAAPPCCPLRARGPPRPHLRPAAPPSHPPALVSPLQPHRRTPFALRRLRPPEASSATPGCPRLLPQTGPGGLSVSRPVRARCCPASPSGIDPALSVSRPTSVPPSPSPVPVRSPESPDGSLTLPALCFTPLRLPSSAAEWLSKDLLLLSCFRAVF